MHDQARVVIIGSGIAGSSIAYHLTERGWRDIVVLEQGALSGGTSSHAPGLVGQLRSSVSLTKMLVYSVALYKTLHGHDKSSPYNPLIGERGADDVDGCVSDLAALVEVDLEQLELTLQMPGTHTEDDATTGKFVERHERLCRLDRMAIAHDVDV